MLLSVGVICGCFSSLAFIVVVGVEEERKHPEEAADAHTDGFTLHTRGGILISFPTPTYPINLCYFRLIGSFVQSQLFGLDIWTKSIIILLDKCPETSLDVYFLTAGTFRATFHFCYNHSNIHTSSVTAHLTTDCFPAGL